MNKEIFCKIIEIDETQGLVVKEYDEDSPEEFPCVKITIKVDGVTVCQKLTFEEEEKRDLAFDKISEETIKKVYVSTKNFFEQK